MSEKVCCVTGHRNIPADKLEYVKSELTREILEAVKDGYTLFISGFAEGTDLLFASIVADLKTEYPALALEAALPYPGRIKTPDALFHKLIAECSIVGVHSRNYQPSCFMKRNRIMVWKSQRVIAVYDGREKGGTLFTMRYAHTQERDVRVIRI